MRRIGIRLLITLVLTALSLGGVWASADARKVTAGRWDPIASHSKPGAQRFNGEPDGNHLVTPPPRLSSGRTQGESQSFAPATASEWARLTSRIWVTQILGTRR